MANNLNKIRNLEDFVPDWDWNGAIQSQRTLMENVDEKAAAVILL